MFIFYKNSVLVEECGHVPVVFVLVVRVERDCEHRPQRAHRLVRVHTNTHAGSYCRGRIVYRWYCVSVSLDTARIVSTYFM